MINGAVICVFSPLGGIGVTSTAKGLAGRLPGFGDACLLDLNADFGMVAEYLNIANEQELVSQNMDSLPGSETMRTSKLALKYLDNLYAIDSTKSPTKPGYYLALIAACRKEFQFTVIDLPHTVTDESVRDALQAADLVIALGDSTPYCRRALIIFFDFATGADG